MTTKPKPADTPAPPESDLEHHYVPAFVNGRYVEVDVFDVDAYIETSDGPTGQTLEMRRLAAQRYVAQLRQQHAQRIAQLPTLIDFEKYLAQAINNRTPEAAVNQLMQWASEQQDVRRAVDVFTREALADHITRRQARR